MNSFPVYIKYKNNKNFFKLISNEEFEELTILGSKYFLTHKKASVHPDRIFILDLLNNTFENTKKISPEDFELQLNNCRQHFVLIG